MTHRGPFQPLPFCDSVWWWCWWQWWQWWWSCWWWWWLWRQRWWWWQWWCWWHCGGSDGGCDGSGAGGAGDGSDGGDSASGGVLHMWDPQPLRPPLPGLGTGSRSGALTPGSTPQPSPPLPLALRSSASPCHRPRAESPHEGLAAEPATSPSPLPNQHGLAPVGAMGSLLLAAAMGLLAFSQQARNSPSRV